MRDTSIDAEKTIQKENLEAIVLSFVQGRGLRGATCDEAEVHLGLRHQTSSARFTALNKRGDIVDSGRRRPTRSGRKAIVWIKAERKPPEQRSLFDVG